MEDQEHERVTGEVSVVRSEERLDVGTVEREAGKVRIRKDVETVPYDEVVSYLAEAADVERVGPDPDDSGEVETLPDGTLSIPVIEEQLVVEKRRVVVERVLVRKRQETREQRVTTELQRERVTVEADAAVEDRVQRPPD